ncbi:MAG: (2Fe-2S) ferredoxin domain-containing protein [Nitrospinae bacterium]|nr:(2Fe-2S) ferredoxin domain-containing protein [Nitrospinota bacterium]
MPKPAYHILVCTNQRPPGHPRGSCGENGAAALLERFGMGIEEKMLFGKAIVSTSSCLGPCSMGPVVIVYPDGVWYNRVKPADVNEILDQHIAQGKKVERLEIPDAVWG